MSDVPYIGPGGRRRRPRPLLRTLLGEVLRRKRLDQGRTLVDVAREARVSMPYLSEVERGLKEASSEVLAALCDALRIRLSDVLAEAGRDLARDLALERAESARRDLARLDPVRRLDPARRLEPARRPGSVRRSGPGRPGDVVLLAA
jgi:transcriptional regulator with XRE-family HTH domain